MAVNETYRQKSREEYRKKRVKRMKQIIIAAILLLFIIPMGCCFFMLIKVNRLEKQVELLVEMHDKEYQAYLEEKEGKEDGEKESSQIIYAAEIEDEAVMAEVSEEPEESKESEELTPEELLEQSTEKKKVYLTFDDGPSQYSDELLDILKKYDVKATFFVIGRTDEKSKKIYKRIVEEGHTLAMHSYTHKYDQIYKSLDSFKKDVEKLSEFLYKTTGVRPKYYRFPGGSSNQVSKVSIKKCISYLNQKGITYYDWNVVNGDATGKNYTAKQMVANVMEGVYKNNNSTVLMHDTVSRDTTVKSLPTLIKRLKKEGYVILPISDYTSPVQHIKASSVK